MFTDIYGFTQLSEIKGRHSLVELAGNLHALLESVIREFGGTVIKSIGDSLMVIFDSPTAAVLCAVEIQKQNKKKNQILPENERVEIRIGINTGEVTELDGDVFGEAVNLASRVEGECEPGGVYFTEATYLAINSDQIKAISAGIRVLKGLTCKVKLFKVPSGEISGPILGKRSLSFFGLLGRDAANKPVVIFPAPVARRIMSGIVDFWISVVLVFLFPIMVNIRPIYSWLTDAVRIEGENLVPGNNYPCSITTAVPEFVEYIIKEYFGRGLRYNEEGELTPNFARASCHRYLRLGSNQSCATTFKGRSGNYDLIYGYSYDLQEDSGRFNGSIRVGSHFFPLISYMITGDSLREVLGRNITVNNGDLIVVEATDNKMNNLELDFLEFVPVGSPIIRPKGISRTWRYWEFYSWIYYDDMNFHFFLIRFPVSFFFVVLVSYLFLGRSLGNVTQHIYLVGEKGRLHFGNYLLRAIVLCLVPFWGGGVFAAGTSID